MKFINRKFVWLILSLIVFSLQANAQEKTFDESMLTDVGKQAYKTLLKVNSFAIGPVGEGGVTSNGEKALDNLIKEKNAVNAFKSLIMKATSEGGLYALFGLKILNCDCLDEQLKVYEKLPEPPKRDFDGINEIQEGYVYLERGCLGSFDKRIDVARKIRDGKDY